MGLKTASYLSVSGATRFEVRDAKGSRTLSKVRFNDFVSLWIPGKGYINWDTSPLMISKEYTSSALVQITGGVGEVSDSSIISLKVSTKFKSACGFQVDSDIDTTKWIIQ